MQCDFTAISTESSVYVDGGSDAAASRRDRAGDAPKVTCLQIAANAAVKNNNTYDRHIVCICSGG